MKIVNVKIRQVQLKKKFEQKVMQMFENTVEQKKDEEGRTKEWYETMGIEVPKELKEKETQYQTLKVDDEYFDFKIKNAYIPLKNIEYIAGNFDEGSDIVLKSGEVIKTIETERKVFNKIKQLNKKTQ